MLPAKFGAIWLTFFKERNQVNLRRQKLQNWIALQAAASINTDREHPVSELRAYPLSEPGSGRRYTVIRLRTRSGLTGFGECGVTTAADVETARKAVLGKAATAYQFLRTGTSLD